jgi:acyl carrier protein
MPTALESADVINCVKRIVISESRLSLGVDELSEDTALQGDVLRIGSLALLGMIVKLEDELDVILPDNLLVGRSFHTLRDVTVVVLSALGLTA